MPKNNANKLPVRFHKGDKVIAKVNVMRVLAEETCTVLDVKPGGSVNYVLVETEDRRRAWMSEPNLKESKEA